MVANNRARRFAIRVDDSARPRRPGVHVPKGPTLDGGAALLARMMRAWERARHLIDKSHSLRRTSHDIRLDIKPAALTNDCIVWASEGGNTQCLVIPHAPDEHEVVVTVNGEVVSRRTFADPVEATDETLRARRLFS